MSIFYVHPFSHLGPAPYQFVGVWTPPSTGLSESNPAAYSAAVSSTPEICRGACDHCGSLLKDHYMIKDSAGSLHVVGSSCIKKTKRDGYKASTMLKEAEKARKDISRKRSWERRRRALETLERFMSSERVKSNLMSKPHPPCAYWRNRETLTLWDYYAAGGRRLESGEFTWLGSSDAPFDWPASTKTIKLIIADIAREIADV